MSDSIALVRFADGEIRCAYYFGSIDIVVPLLFPLESAATLLEGGMESLSEGLADLEELTESDDVEPVQVWSDYGATAWWEGRASKSQAVLWDGSDPYGFEFTESGNPDAPPPRQVWTSKPEWLPDGWGPFGE